MNCGMTGCCEPPRSIVSWGGINVSRNVPLCKEHMDELWKAIKP